MWEAIAKKRDTPPHGTLILFGPEAASSFAEFGPVSKSTELVTYHRSQHFTDEGMMQCSLDIFRIRSTDKSIVSQIPSNDSCLLISVFNWTQTESWKKQLEQIEAVLELRPMKVLLTTTNLENIPKQSLSVAALNKSFDIHHLYLRTLGMKLGASVVYSTDSINIEIDWASIVSHIMKVPFSDNPAPSEQLYGSLVVVYENDSREKILAIYPEFEFENAWQNNLILPEILDTKQKKYDKPSGLALPEEFEQTISEYKRQDLQHTRHPRISRVLPEGTDDKVVISEFFSTLVQRSS